MPPPRRPMKRILVANRGEIAIRILQSLRELPDPPVTYAVYTSGDSSHVLLGGPTHSISLPSSASYTDVTYLVSLVKDHSIDAVNPGYGFLSESEEFSRRCWEEAGVVVVGPGWDVLRVTGDKVAAKSLARRCGVPTLPALENPTDRAEELSAFVSKIGLPVMIKAVDGGGGRGIRLVGAEGDLEGAFRAAVSESPGKKVFVEKAATKDYRHIEVQIVGDGNGEVRHLWERDCSVQRRFQKIVEIAPSPVRDRKIVGKVIEAAVRMAKEIKYLGLGTWEFLANTIEDQFYFLEINPRIQVEHTITESITSVDLVTVQVLLAQGHSLQDVGLGEIFLPEQPPSLHSLQLRICAESPNDSFALSIGKIGSARLPSGNGIRVDSHLLGGAAVVVGPDFDNLLAKVIVTGTSWEQTVRKARRALQDTHIDGVKTNIALLQAILAHDDLRSGSIDIQWLESKLEGLIEFSNHFTETKQFQGLFESTTSASAASTSSGSLFRKGDAWSITLEENSGQDSPQSSQPYHLSLERVLRNEFPSSFSAEIAYTTPTQTGSTTVPYRLTVNSTSASASAMSSRHRRGDPNNKSHLIVPMAGKLIEVLVLEGDIIQVNDVVAFVKQMKMELEIRSPRAGRVTWALELEGENGEDVAEGVLLAEVEEEEQVKEATPGLKGRL
ncbi:MAG: hypothetical protein Q9160_003297 [Pyrenula sp. 1 TL-2023]